jgi:predicted glycoside hydrolase/deacetylase ChbG (UPF0249 family)
MKFLIVNGDDFGASPGITRGIMEAHQRGILTSTSLMVNTPTAKAAAATGRATPELSVGLHADVTVEMNDSSAGLDLRLAAALDDQLRLFEKLMGGPPTHLDSHHNSHRDPRVLPHFLELARRHGLPLREHSPVRYFSSFYGQWGGASHPEHISTENLARMFRAEVGEGITELSCHPGYVEPEFVSGYTAERELEVRTLCDPVIRHVLAEQETQLVSYHDLKRVTGAEARFGDLKSRISLGLEV